MTEFLGQFPISLTAAKIPFREQWGKPALSITSTFPSRPAGSLISIFSGGHVAPWIAAIPQCRLENQDRRLWWLSSNFWVFILLSKSVARGTIPLTGRRGWHLSWLGSRVGTQKSRAAGLGRIDTISACSCDKLVPGAFANNGRFFLRPFSRA